MSRVADALRRANAIQLQPVRTEEAHAALASGFLHIETPEEVSANTAPPPSSRGLKAHPLLRQRWVRRILRFAGIRTGAPAPTFRGLTRVGQPCRGPAMANGFCRQHGGSRSGILAETRRSVLQRLSEMH